ncbi:hypothetical protein ACKWTF_006557 [Chironomus riparius]
MQQQACIKACELILLIQSIFSHYSWKFYSSYNSPIFQLSKMFKLVTFVTLFAVAFSAPQHAAKYPAGVDPSKCPNFPICDNAALHAKAPAYNHWDQPAAHWNQPAQAYNHWDHQPAAPQWAPAPQWNNAAQYNHVAPAAPKAAAKYPAGVDPRSCPDFPYCPTPILPGHHAHHVAPLPGFTERLYPAGVSAHTCPNYPEC